MKTIQFIFFLCSACIPTLLAAQFTAPQQVIASSGLHAVLGNQAQISYTVGEAVVTTLTGNEAILTQGFHQSRLLVTPAEEPVRNATLKVFPNPTSLSVTIESQDDRFSGATMYLFDTAGKMVKQQQAAHGTVLQEKFDLEDLPAGIYWLRIGNRSDMNYGVFKIVKQ